MRHMQSRSFFVHLPATENASQRGLVELIHSFLEKLLHRSMPKVSPGKLCGHFSKLGSPFRAPIDYGTLKKNNEKGPEIRADLYGPDPNPKPQTRNPKPLNP